MTFTSFRHLLSFALSLWQVYIAPMKALVQDKLRDWTQRFSSLGLKCQELTSDSGPSNVLDMLDTDVILTTPEVTYS